MLMPPLRFEEDTSETLKDPRRLQCSDDFSISFVALFFFPSDFNPACRIPSDQIFRVRLGFLDV